MQPVPAPPPGGPPDGAVERDPTRCLWRRFWAQLLDAAIVVGAVGFAYGATGVVYLDGSRRPVMPAGWWAVLGLWAVWILYGTVTEALPGHGSAGKRLFRVRVVDRSGAARITLWQSFLRNLFRIPDEFLFPLAGLFVAWASVGRRRMGDMVGRTLVVHAAAVGDPITTPWGPARDGRVSRS